MNQPARPDLPPTLLQGAPVTQMTYPISPDYVKSWTPARAICEFIANALDEDQGATVTYADGTLTITDNGPGIPEEGLILGYSPKGDEEIGQFGEGSKIAALVLARSEEIGTVEISTIGYGFIPTVETRTILDGIAPRRSKTPPQVLVYTFTDSDRTAGTEVRIECGKDVADEAISRFRHLTETGYTPPVEAPDIILDGDPGRLYIGGVLVSKLPRFKASYDFPLASAKRAQNRDRTVIDSEEIVRLVSSALAASARQDVIEHFVSAVLAGARLVEAEKYFSFVESARVKAAFRAVGDATFAGRDVFYSRWGSDESTLALLDGSFELVKTNLDQGSHNELMELLGVSQARTAYQNYGMKPETRKKTTYVARAKLSVTERANLDAATASVRRMFGDWSVGEVRVYSATDDARLSCAAGFYTPVTGQIALSREILSDPDQLLDTLLHESAHRRAHRRGGEYMDRTRGFDNELTRMLVTAVRAAEARGSEARESVPVADIVPVPSETVAARESDPATTGIPRVRKRLEEIAGRRVAEVVAERGYRGDRQLSESLALHPNYLRLLTNARPAGWRNRSQMAPSTTSDFEKIEVISEALSLTSGLVWAAHVLCEGPKFGRKEARPGPWGGRICKLAAPAVESLRALDGEYAEAADCVAGLLDGTVDSSGDPDEWTSFLLPLLDAESRRLWPEGM